MIDDPLNRQQPQQNSDQGIQQLSNIAQNIGQLVADFATVLAAVGVTTTRGDLIARGASGNGRLPIGAAQTLLATDGTDPVWRTLTAEIDAAIGSVVQGDVLYRGASAWARLGAGTANQKFLTGGAAANPSWGSGLVTIDSGSLPAAATKTFSSIPAVFNHLILQVTGLSTNTAARHPLVQIGHTTVDATAGNYIGAAAFTEASLFNAQFTDQAAAATWTFTCYIRGYQGGPNAQFVAIGKDSTGVFASSTGLYVGVATAIDIITILINGAGSFDAGTYALYGAL